MQKIFKTSLFTLLIFSFSNPLTYACHTLPPPVVEVCPPKYKLIDLGLQASDQSEVVAVNDCGKLAGSYSMQGKKCFFIWDEKEGITLLPLPATSNILVLNNANQIAGNYKDSSGCECGFIWDKSRGFCDLGSLGGNFTHVHSMNDLGQIVGESACAHLSLVDHQQVRHAFVWECGKIMDLGALYGDMGMIGDKSQATSINNKGQILGTANSLIAHKGKTLRSDNHAVLWEKGVITKIEPHFNGITTGLSINDLGFVTYYKQGYQTNGTYLINLATKQMDQLQGPCCEMRLNNKGDLFRFAPHDLVNGLDIQKRPLVEVLYKEKKAIPTCYMNEVIHKSVSPCALFNLVATKPWKLETFQAYSFSNHRWIAGVAQNMYGEQHAVVLVPEKN